MLGRDSRPQMSVPQIAELLRFSYKEKGVCAQEAAGRAPSARGTRGVEQVSCAYTITSANQGFVAQPYQGSELT